MSENLFPFSINRNNFFFLFVQFIKFYYLMDGFQRRKLSKEKRPSPEKNCEISNVLRNVVRVHNCDGRFDEERVNICRVSKDHIASSRVISSLDRRGRTLGRDVAKGRNVTTFSVTLSRARNSVKYIWFITHLRPPYFRHVFPPSSCR